MGEGQAPAGGPGAYAAEVAAWDAERDRRLRNPNGWLALVGLHWLTDGVQAFGADPTNPIHLAGRSVPPHGGTLELTGGRVTLHPEPRSGVAVDGTALDGDLFLADDRGQPPTVVDLGALRFHVIRRGDRIGLRVRDTELPVLESFPGVPRFGVDLASRVTGHLERPPGLRTIEVPDVLGEVHPEASPGVVHFELGAEHLHLDALPEDDDMLWLIFGDTTNGAQTYAGGRFLVTGPVAEDGSVVLDFNLAYNPPCVFSPYATCPLPWPANRLLIAVEAGEQLPPSVGFSTPPVSG